MASSSTRSIVLLPILPKYAAPIMEGTKRVEFRKRAFGRQVSHVVVYSSSPVKQVVGFFKILDIDEASPEQLWRRYSQVGGIEKSDFDRYFAQAPRGVAIKVGKVHVLSQPLPLSLLQPGFRPPQSYAYLSQEVFERIRSRTLRKKLPRVTDGRQLQLKAS